jgi:hypothetical protein
MPELSSRDITSYMLMNVLALASRRLITTEGGWLGLAPEEVQKGDVVANLYGCNSPVVLRPSDQYDECRYLVIGECYVDGIMDGELIVPKNQGEYKYEHIYLC